MTERRTFVKYKSSLGHTFAIFYHHEGSIKYPKDLKIIYEHEISTEWWDLPLSTYIDFFEWGIKPKRKLIND